MALLRSAEGVFRLLAEEARDFAILLIDPEGRIAYWNTGAARIFGYATAEIVGQPFHLLFTEEDRSGGAPDREMEKARKTGRAEDSRWLQKKDGSLFFSDGVTTPIVENDEFLGFAKMHATSPSGIALKNGSSRSWR